MTLRGVYVGNSPTALQQFENWLGSEIEVVHGVVGMANWSDFTNSANWMTNTLWKGINERVHWSVPIMVTDGSASLAQAARGAYDSYYATVAKTLLASRAGDNDPIHVRTGWEANGEWFKWTAVGHEQEFIGAFRHFAALTGLGAMLEELGRDREALDAYSRALAIYPTLKAAQDAVARLSEELSGQPA